MNSLLKRYSIVTRRTFVDWIKFKNLIFLKPFPKTPSAVPTCHLLEKRWTELLCNFVIPPLPSYRACMNNFFSSETRGKRNCRHYLPLSSVAVLQATTRSVKMEKSFPGSHRLTIFKKSSAICPWEFLIWRFACVTKSRLKRFFSGGAQLSYVRSYTCVNQSLLEGFPGSVTLRLNESFKRASSCAVNAKPIILYLYLLYLL